MKADEFSRIWNEICFLLHDSIKPDINEKDFENQVVRAIEKLGWLEYEGEVKRQPTLKLGRNTKIRPDLAIYGPKGNALVAIEVKRPLENLSKEEPTYQLTSYMLQMKAIFGLLIGKRIRIYYDGKLHNKQKPILLDRISFEKNSNEGINFVSIFMKNNFLTSKNEPIIKELYKKIIDSKTIEKLRSEILSDATKDKLIGFLKNEFVDYGSDVIEGALSGLKISLEIETEKELIPRTQIPTRKGRKSKQNVFIESLDKNGQRVFQKFLDLAKSNSFPIHWGAKGFSLNVDLDGTHVSICFGYPPNSLYKQSLYTGLMGQSGILNKTNATEELVQSLQADAQETGLFQQAGRELKCMIDENITEKKIDSLLSWCKKVADLIKNNGLKK